ncbi:MAG: hypothetical protein ACLR6I_01655 [Waltera sp.]
MTAILTAQIIWGYGMLGDNFLSAIREAVEAYAEADWRFPDPLFTTSRHHTGHRRQPPASRRESSSQITATGDRNSICKNFYRRNL